MKIIQITVSLGLMTLPLLAVAEGDSPWLPIPGQALLSVSQTEQSAKNAYVGMQELSISTITGGAASKYKRSTTALRLDYGISDAVAVDATVGYGEVRTGNADNSSGLTDSYLGVNWRIVDEVERTSFPTLTLRAAAIIKGDYEGGRLAALGNNANGLEVAAIIGKQLTSTVSVWGELGIQDRTKNVPTARFVDLNARWRFYPKWTAGLGYSVKHYGGNLDIGAPGFTPAQFQKVREQRDVIKASLGYALAGNQGVAVNLAKVTDGRNTVKDDSIVGLSYTYGF